MSTSISRLGGVMQGVKKRLGPKASGRSFLLGRRGHPPVPLAGGAAMATGRPALHAHRRALGTQSITCQASGSTQGPPCNRTPWVKFCSACGAAVRQEVPEGETMYRPVCIQCERIEYVNPKMVVGCLVEHEGKVLLCKRAIEPCAGKWTLPAGYLELDESTAAGAARETLEEANAAVTVTAPLAYMDIPRIGQSYIIFRATLDAPFSFGPGPESLEVELFDVADIPFDEIAFSAISVVLQNYIEDIKGGAYAVHNAVIDKKEGSSPFDPHGYTVRDHIRTPTSLSPVAGAGSASVDE